MSDARYYTVKKALDAARTADPGGLREAALEEVAYRAELAWESLRHEDHGAPLYDLGRALAALALTPEATAPDTDPGGLRAEVERIVGNGPGWASQYAYEVLVAALATTGQREGKLTNAELRQQAPVRPVEDTRSADPGGLRLNDLVLRWSKDAKDQDAIGTDFAGGVSSALRKCIREVRAFTPEATAPDTDR